MTIPTSIREATRDIPVACKSDVVVVGGGPAGLSAAVSASRNGVSVTLLERYPYLGGLASGGMVLVLDDMHNDLEITVQGLGMEIIERMQKWDLAVVPPEADRQPDVRQTEAMWRKWSRWNLFDFHTHTTPHPIIFAAAFDPDGFKRAANDMVGEAGVNLRLHSWFSSAIVEDGVIKGVIVESKEGRQAILADVVIDATGDLDVAASAGAPFAEGSFIVTTVSRMGGVDTDAAERFQFGEPERFAEIDREAKRIIGGCWQHWWLKTPLPGVVWCNCPHMTGFDGLKVGDLTAAEFEGRRRMTALLDFARKNVPGFENAYVVDFAPQTGVRQTRLLEGDYVVTKQDVMKRVYFDDTSAAAATTTRLTERFCPRMSSSCWWQAGIIRRRRRRKSSAAKSRPAWLRAKRPESRRPSHWMRASTSAMLISDKFRKRCGRKGRILVIGRPTMP